RITSALRTGGDSSVPNPGLRYTRSHPPPGGPMADRPIRLGDVLDDYCPRCRLLLNHDVASLFQAEVAKVTCRTCYNTHDYKHAQGPPKRGRGKKEDPKSRGDQVLAGMAAPPSAPTTPTPPPVKKRRDLWADVERLKKK